MRLTIHLGHLLWQTLQLLGGVLFVTTECPALQCPVLWQGPRLLPMLPSWAQPKALEIFRFAHYAFKLGGAMGIGCVSDVFSRRYTCQNRTSGKILPGELMHWKDSLLL